MRRFIVFLIALGICLWGVNARPVLEEFFDGRDYETSIYELSDKKLYFSCSWVEKEKLIWDRGMLYQKRDGRIEPLLTLDEEMRVYNSQELIADLEFPALWTFYGWKSYIYEDERKRYVIFSVRPLADMGKDIIDANITFIWDYESHVYKEQEIDWNEM